VFPLREWRNDEAIPTTAMNRSFADCFVPRNDEIYLKPNVRQSLENCIPRWNLGTRKKNGGFRKSCEVEVGIVAGVKIPKSVVAIAID
jgi:hypothetical protein